MTKGIALISTAGIGALALGVGLIIRPWLHENAAEARGHPGLGEPAQPGSYATLAPEETPAHAAATTPAAVTTTAAGIEVSAANFRRQDDRFMADICFALPDNSDWTIWVASLEYAGGRISEFGFMPLEVREPEYGGSQRVIRFDEWRHTVTWEPAQPGAPGRRCDALYFELPSTSDFAAFTLTIEWLAAAPREGEVCTPAYLESVRRALEQRGVAGVEIACKVQEVGGGMIEGLSVVGAPSWRARQDAEALLTSQAFFLETRGIEGPWQFAGSLSR